MATKGRDFEGPNVSPNGVREIEAWVQLKIGQKKWNIQQVNASLKRGHWIKSPGGGVKHHLQAIARHALAARARQLRAMKQPETSAKISKGVRQAYLERQFRLQMRQERKAQRSFERSILKERRRK